MYILYDDDLHQLKVFQQPQPWRSGHEQVLLVHTISNFQDPLQVLVDQNQNLQQDYRKRRKMRY